MNLLRPLNDLLDEGIGSIWSPVLRILLHIIIGIYWFKMKGTLLMIFFFFLSLANYGCLVIGKTYITVQKKKNINIKKRSLNFYRLAFIDYQITTSIMKRKTKIVH